MSEYAMRVTLTLLVCFGVPLLTAAVLVVLWKPVQRTIYRGRFGLVRCQRCAHVGAVAARISINGYEPVCNECGSESWTRR